MNIFGYIFFLNLFKSEAARILVVIPTPSVSHQIPFQPLTQELARRGHDVTIITTDPAFPKGEAPANLTEIDVHDISYEKWQKLFQVRKKQNKKMKQNKFLLELQYDSLKGQMKTNVIQTLMAEKQFDLLMLEACVRPTLVLSHIFKVPVIQNSSMGSALLNYEDIRAFTHPLLYPIHFHRRSYNHSFREKVTETYFEYELANMATEINEDFDEWAKKNIDPNIPPIN